LPPPVTQAFQLDRNLERLRYDSFRENYYNALSFCLPNELYCK
jgi:hypothetical protein